MESKVIVKDDDIDDIKNAPIVKMIEYMFKNSIEMRASDIHIEPYEKEVRIRYRIDGELSTVNLIGIESLPPLVARIKILAGLNIAEKRIPQDGRIITKVDEKEVDLRVSILPVVYGEKVVIRILDKNNYKVHKEHLGLSTENINKLNRIISNPHGIVLVTGPTGSGKSTTLASLIDIINTNQERHIITLEDPIEYVHNHKKSLVNQREIGQDTESFNSALRAILRQDPDVILVGEMRDPETISIALTAAETGHLVFSTLHTVGAAKTIDRIVDMFPSEQQQQVRTQLSTVCQGVISQQLLQTIDGRRRVAALEVMVSTPAISNLIRENKTYQIPNMIQTGSKFGMQSMDQELVNLYRKGVITRESVLSRCTDYEYTSRLVGNRY